VIFVGESAIDISPRSLYPEREKGKPSVISD
jgi:hypothetical protein